MIYITSTQKTALTKKPFQSSHPDNTSSPVPPNKVYGVDSFGEIKNNKQLVSLAYGAGDWWIYLPHWKKPGKIDKKFPTKADQFSRKPFPNTKDGNIKRIIAVAQDFGCTKAQTAYLLATTRWETGNKFIPNIEAYWLSESWRKRNLRYYPYFGRGFAHITWEKNYEKFEKIMGLPLVKHPNMVLDPDVAAFILVYGSMNGTFSGVALPEYVAIRKRDYYNARRVINGLDKAKEIEVIAEAWYQGETLKKYDF